MQTCSDRVLWRLIWVYAVWQCPFDETLKHTSRIWVKIGCGFAFIMLKETRVVSFDDQTDSLKFSILFIDT